MPSLKILEKRIELRNAQVEVDKACEISKTRKAILTVLTYLSVAVYFIFIGINKPWLNAIVPSLAFILSTLTLTFFKKFWQRNIRGQAN